MCIRDSALAARFEALERQRHDLVRGDVVVPVVGNRVRREDNEPARGEFALDGVRAFEAGDAEEWRQVFGIAQRGAHFRYSIVDLVAHAVDRQTAKTGWMTVAMRADGVALLVDAPHHGGIGAGHFAHHEICRLHALGGEDIEDLIGVGRQRAVIESEDDLLVGERERVGILHAPDALQLRRIDGKHAARSQRVRISGASLGAALSWGLLLILRGGLGAAWRTILGARRAGGERRADRRLSLIHI